MGFDNECILNIQSLPGEYFCPYCRTLVYPNDALQSQCTHLYCKPCLVYIAATTRACPYDGYLVTEADSKLLVESNKPLAETLGRVAVRCLYNRSGCQWQGSLSDSTTHCTECSFGNSAVICNRCGTQILHRQIQEHGQTCVGMQPEAQQAEGQIQDSKVQIQTVGQGQSSVASAALSSGAVSTAVVSAPASVPLTAATSVQSQTQGNAVSYPHAAAQTPTPEQLHQQQQLQYQQYYQQFPGYDPYQQQYPQYAQYQQQIYPLYAQHQMQAVPQQVVQGQQPQPYMVHPQQPQHHPHSQPQLGAQPQPQPQLQPQPLTQLVPLTQPQPQHPQLQPQILVPSPQLHAPVPQLHPQVQQIHSQNQTPPVQLTNVQPQQNQPPFHAQQSMQPHAAAHHPLSQPQQLPQPPPVQAVAQHQQPHPQMQHLQPRPQQQPHPLTHPHPQHQLPPGQTQPCPMTQPQPFAQPQPQFPPPPPVQQLPPGAPQYPTTQQYPSSLSTHLHNQFPPQQAPQMRPPHAQLPMQVQQHQPMILSQGSHVNLVPPQQPAHLTVHQQGQQIHQQQVMQPYAQQQGLPPQQAPLHPSQPQQQGAFPSQQLMRPQQRVHAHGLAYAQEVPAQPHFQQNAIPAPPNHQSQTIPARPMMPNDGMLQPPYQQATATSSMLMQSGMNHKQPNHNYPLRSTTQLPSSSGLHLGYAQENQPTQPASQVAMQSGPQTNTSTNKQINQSGPADLKNPESENDSKCVDIEETTASEGKVRINPNSNNSDNLESAEKLVENGFGSHAKDANTEVPVLDSFVKEENRESVNVGTGEHSGKPSEPGQMKDSSQLPDGTGTARPHFDTDKVAKEQLSLDPDKNNQRVVSQGKISDDIAKNKHPPQHLSHQSHQYGHKQQASSVPGQASYPMQQSTYGQPPALQDRMIPQHMAHPSPNQEQKFLDPLHHHIQAHGQAAGSSQMRPPMHNFSQPFPHQWQPPITHEAFQSPMGRTPHGHPHSEISRSNFQETDFPPPSAMALGPSGSHQRDGPHQSNFQEQTLVPPGKEQNHMLPPGPRGPTFGIEDHLGRPRPNFVEAEGYAVKGTHFGGWQNDPQHSAVRSSPMTLNSVPPRGVTGGMHDERFGPVPEERHKPFPEQGFKLWHEEQFLPSAFGPGAPVVNRREFEEDLKRFPRPVHLDHGMPALDGYTSSMRPLERLHQPFGPDAIPRPLDRPDGNSAAWPLPSYRSGGSFPPKSDVNPTDIGDRPRAVGPFDVIGRKVDTGYGHPNHRMDGEFTGIQSGRFGSGSQSHMEDLGIRELPGFGNWAKAFNLPPSSSVGSAYHESKLFGNLLPHQHFGEQMGGRREFLEPGYVNRDGFPIEAKCFSSTFPYDGMDSFEHSMLRKPGSMGWCRICRIDCGSAEGLDLHSQTREHQKMSMNLVLSIKQENAKKQHLPNF